MANRVETLERERRGQKLAGFSAIAAAPLFIASLAIQQSGGVPLGGPRTERFRAIESASSDLLLSAILASLAIVAIIPPLLYLFRAAQARSERVNRAMVGFIFLGPGLLAVQGIVAYIAQSQVASDFVAQAGAGGDIYSLLEDLIDDSTAFQAAASLYIPASIGFVVAMFYTPLQAMRVGLLSRFFATLGMALGVSSLFIVPGLSVLALMIWFGWLGFTILERTPKGRPPAWDAGEAVPWPKPGEEPVTPPPVAVVEGDATEAFESQPSDHSARRERARKRKRKRRR
jgi:hypothetical protein